MQYKRPSFDNQSLIEQIKNGPYKVADFEWRFAVTAKHSLVVNHTECLIQLKLQLQGEEANDRKTVNLQLSMGQFNQLFREMEKVANMLSIIH